MLRSTPAGPSSSFVESTVSIYPTRFAGWLPYLLTPEPDAPLIVITSPATLAAALAAFPAPGGRTFDFEAMAAAGYAGVHLTAVGATSYRPAGFVMHEQTLWLRWAFTGEAVPAGPDAAQQEAEADAKLLENLRFRYPWPLQPVLLAGRYRGHFIVVRPLSLLRGVPAWLRNALAADSVEDSRNAATILFIDHCIVAHNFRGEHGFLLATGEGLCHRLAETPAGVAPAIAPDNGWDIIKAILFAAYINGALPMVAGGAPVPLTRQA